MINIHGKHVNSHQWDFGYYANFQLPFTRSRYGFDTFDLEPGWSTALEMERCR